VTVYNAEFEKILKKSTFFSEKNYSPNYRAPALDSDKIIILHMENLKAVQPPCPTPYPPTKNGGKNISNIN
jgi:hypothetical protein